MTEQAANNSITLLQKSKKSSPQKLNDSMDASRQR